MAYRVPFINPKGHYFRLKREIDDAISSCLANGDLIYRRQLKEFEESLAAFVGVKYAVGVNSGYHALHMALLGANIGPCDEVITVAHTFVATISAIVHAGATPVLIDIGSDFNMDPDLVEAAITKRTKAILPVHLNGRVCPMDRLEAIASQHGLKIIEDAAQALGATFAGRRAGSFGQSGCFSFYPFKILGGFGDGGALVTNDEGVARAARLLRYNGEDRETGEYHYHGYTALLDNVQAAVLSAKLPHLPSWIGHRRMLAERYRSGLAGVPGVVCPAHDGGSRFDAFQNYVIRVTHRDGLRTHLKDEGIETLIHWQKPVWMHQALDLGNIHLPATEACCREVLSLPMSAETTVEEVDIVTASICSFAMRSGPAETAAAGPQSRSSAPS